MASGSDLRLCFVQLEEALTLASGRDPKAGGDLAQQQSHKTRNKENDEERSKRSYLAAWY